MSTKILNPQITESLTSLSTLGTFAGAAAASAAAAVPSPLAMPPSVLTDDLVSAYNADEQADRVSLFRGAVAKMEDIVASLKTVEVLIDAPDLAPVPGYVPPPPPPAPVIEPAPAAMPAEPLPS